MKGVVLAGGLGTRLLPLTRVTNKHLLPVHNLPMVFYPIQALVNIGITEILVVTGGHNGGYFLLPLDHGAYFASEARHAASPAGEGGIACWLPHRDKRARRRRLC